MEPSSFSGGRVEPPIGARQKGPADEILGCSRLLVAVGVAGRAAALLYKTTVHRRERRLRKRPNTGPVARFGNLNVRLSKTVWNISSSCHESGLCWSPESGLNPDTIRSSSCCASPVLKRIVRLGRISIKKISLRGVPALGREGSRRRREPVAHPCRSQPTFSTIRLSIPTWECFLCTPCRPSLDVAAVPFHHKCPVRPQPVGNAPRDVRRDGMGRHP